MKVISSFFLIATTLFIASSLFSCENSNQSSNQQVQEQNEFLIEEDFRVEQTELLKKISWQMNYINATVNNLLDSLSETNVSENQLEDVREDLEDKYDLLERQHNELQTAEESEWDELVRETDILLRNIRDEIGQIEGLSEPEYNS